MAPRELEYNATVVERVDLSPALAIFKVRPDTPIEPATEEKPEWFIPGQYMVIGLNNEEKPELGSVRRPMSIASSPRQRDTIDFYIRFVSHPASGNPLTHLLWKQRAGDRIYLRFPVNGHFTVHHCVGDSDPRLKVMVAAGTGLAPFTSTVFAAAECDPQASLAEFAILHGASYPQELGYLDELEALTARGLRYLSTVSRPQEAPDWTGYSGRVEDFFLPERLEETERALGLEPGGLTPDNCSIFICGLTGTIGMTVERLFSRHFVPDHRRIRHALEIPETRTSSLFFEQYDSTPILNVKDPAELERLKALLPPDLTAS